MPLLFIEYTNLIIEEYEEMRKKNKLSPLLMHPTTASIRQECLHVYQERKNKDEVEEDILRSFFGVPPPGKDFGYIIERFHADRFRPLRSLIKREVKAPALVNVELLAWLIDFKPRPLPFAQKVLAISGDDAIKAGGTITGTEGQACGSGRGVGEGAAENQSAEADISQTKEMQPPGTKGSTGRPLQSAHRGAFKENAIGILQKRTFKKAGAGVLAISILAGGMYLFNHQKKSSGSRYGSNSNTPCMYWAFDHYERVPCNEERKGRLFLPLEEDRLRNLRMITRKDTITNWSVGKIFYIKDNNEIKYYTGGGLYPEDLKRSLHILSQNIFDKDSLNRKKTY